MAHTIILQLGSLSVAEIGSTASSSESPQLTKLTVEVEYMAAIGEPIAEGAEPDATTELVPRSTRITFLKGGEQRIVVNDPYEKRATLNILRSNGAVVETHLLELRTKEVTHVITTADIQAVLDAEEEDKPTAPVTMRCGRNAQFVTLGEVSPDYRQSRLGVFLIGEQEHTLLEQHPAFSTFGLQTNSTTAAVVLPNQVSGLGAVAWTEAHVGMDGRFSFSFDRKLIDGKAEPTSGWIWWLSGDHGVIGHVAMDITTIDRGSVLVTLPVLGKAGADPLLGKDPCGNCAPVTGVPNDVSEAELLDNADVFNEDPGTFCKPFSNPERILSEKAFAVVSRIEQPDISPIASIRLRSQHLLDVQEGKPTPPPPPVQPLPGYPVSYRAHAPLAAEPFVSAMLKASGPKRYKETKEVEDEVNELPSGRTDMSAEQPIQWEDNIAQYQAVTVALGHILEFRVRTRSAGYSLGHVASTLTLAPRQTKRIQKVEFERVERARREERTRLNDEVSDEVTRERDYEDTVAANLSEWSTGSSSSGTAAVAGGIGFVAGPIIGGVGGGTSKAWSDSSQSGERGTSASEQQRLRDAIRRHGDAQRRFQSTVVTEVSQMETVTGTTEVLRNPNYGHSVTVIYHQILRHLRVSTEFAGVRECLYVPFAVKPFTAQRAYRWRESIQLYLRTPRFRKALTHLRDVLTGFANSNIEAGRRCDQNLNYLRGSLYLTIAVDRPADGDEGKYDAAKWAAISPFLGVPAYGIWAKLAARTEAQRDADFQREHAPTIAAKWVNSLQLKIYGAAVKADFTLATSYRFNQTVRVDFTIPLNEAVKLTRTHLVNVEVKATVELPPGSSASATRLSMRYGTANFQRSLEGTSGRADLLEPGTSKPDEGAAITIPLDSWDLVDERANIVSSVGEFVEHLNEHVEFYHKAVWWNMDRDRLLMLLDGFNVPGGSKLSIASVVDREPIAIIGNSLVYRIGAGFFLGTDTAKTPQDLYAQYAGREPAQDDLRVSLPTDGLYAKTIMDECSALEEHQGSVDWVLNDPDPELGTIDPSLMMSRRADVSSTLTPTQMPTTIINLQNAPDAPAPTGLGGVLGAVTNANSFRDMAGLAGTQANAAAALQTAASLATNFGNQAAALKMAETVKNKQATEDVNKRLAAVRRAKELNLIDDEDVADHTNRILSDTHSTEVETEAPHSNVAINAAIETAKDIPGSTIEATTADGSARLTIGQPVAMGKKEIATLLIYDKSLEEEHVNALMATSYKKATKKAISSFEDLSAVLAKYSKVETLVIFTHSIPGSLLLDGHAPTAAAQSAFFTDSRVRITKEIRFEGCSIMKNPVETCRLVSGISESNVKVTGYTMYSVYQSMSFQVPKKGRSTVRLRAKIDAFVSGKEDYLVPDQPSIDVILGKPGKHVLTLRWFREEYDAAPLPDEPSLRRRIFSSKALIKRTIATAADVQQAQLDFAQPVLLAPEEVTVTDIPAVLAAGTP